MAGNQKYHAFWVHINVAVKSFSLRFTQSYSLFCVVKEKKYCGTTEPRKVIYGSGKPYVYPEALTSETA